MTSKYWLTRLRFALLMYAAHNLNSKAELERLRVRQQVWIQKYDKGFSGWSRIFFFTDLKEEGTIETMCTRRDFCCYLLVPILSYIESLQWMDFWSLYKHKHIIIHYLHLTIIMYRWNNFETIDSVSKLWLYSLKDVLYTVRRLGEFISYH